ncbi:aminodeoxychorismate synthase component I [Amphibacillus marinus]|nr:aminodeoxychorismate synthase component I [Amphibacillus marinus]
MKEASSGYRYLCNRHKLSKILAQYAMDIEVIMMKEVNLRFDFSNGTQEGQSLLFKNPERIFSTYKRSEIVPILKELEQEIELGRYIAGYLSYEAAPAFDVNYQVNSGADMPLLWFASFKKPSPAPPFSKLANFEIANWQDTQSYHTYQDNIRKIKEAIRIGDTYQVNYTTRLLSNFKGDGASFYHKLMKNQQASYSAFLDLENYQILSASPELFFKVNNGVITTKPMKGTAKRGLDYYTDEEQKAYLTGSEKERAENLMIVDLLRNDLGKIAVEGSVHVPHLLSVETYPTVHQMTSTIKATLKPESGLTNWLAALFPCGSITGAPKIKTMAYIKQLESTARNVYCGTIGYVTPNNEAVFNVPIRTVTLNKQTGRALYGVGGGITWDSESELEYDEIQTKAALLTAEQQSFSLLESLSLCNGQFERKEAHLKRLTNSAEYFQFNFNKSLILNELSYLAKRFPSGHYKVRLLVNKKGLLKQTIAPLKPLESNVTCYLAKTPITTNTPFVYHKTTQRQCYQKLAVNEEDNFSTLLWNKQGHLTEFTIGNLVLKLGNEFVTPPLNSGLLPGVFRDQLLKENRISEKILAKKDINEAEEIWLINSVRGWVRINEIK